MSIDNLWRNSNERMSKRTMKSIIAYLLAFTMMATIATQAFLPAVAAADAQNSVSVVQVETGSEEETGEPASQQPDETDPETVVTEEATSQESTSEEAAPEEVVAEESTSGEASSEVSTSEEASSEELVSDENASGGAASSEAASEEASSSEAASQEEAELLDEELLAEEEEQETLDEVEEPTEVVPNGGVNAVISAAMALNRDVSFTMTLYRNGENVAQTSGTLKQNGEGGASQVKLSGTGLEAGSYEVVISAPGFASYSQSLEVSQNMYSELTLYTGELSGYGSAAHPGVLRVGDADGDGVLSETDADTIVNAIQHGVQGGLADLDGSGEVDLADLQLLAANLTEDQTQVGDVYSTVQTRVADNLAKPQVSDTVTVTSGSLEDLVNDNGGVKLETTGEISEQNPIAVDFNFAGDDETVTADQLPKMDGMTIQAPAESEGAVTAGTVDVTYVDENGEEQTMQVQIEEQKARGISLFSLFTTSATATRKADGTLEINFGKQVAVKKITLTITATQSNNLAEISKVEFLNGMENRIPEPELDIPTGLSGTGSDKAFLLTWKPAVNVTAYEVKITGPVKGSSGNVTATIRTTSNQLLVDSLNGSKLVNGKDYTVQVQSLNGEWSSGYCEPITVKPVVEKMPAAPDNLEATGGYRSISLHWKDMDDTDSYTVLYRKKSDADAEYTVAAKNIAANSYKIDNLEENAEYEVTVYGTNELGDGPNAIPALAKTLSLQPAWMPSYKLINTSNGAGQLTAHIQSVTTMRGTNMMVNSPLDAAGSNSGLGVVDGDQSSYYYVGDWDDGVSYGNTSNRGLRVTFDGSYEFGAMALAEPENGAINSIRVWYRDQETGSLKEITGLRTNARTDENGRRHIYIDFGTKITTDQIQICTNTGWTRAMKIGELRFYGYDSIYEDIMALYADDYHTTLREDVDQSVIDALYTRLNTPDAASNELHPNYTQLKRELDTAADLLANSSSLRPVQHVKAMGANVSGYADNSLGFTGLNPWQPLGVTAAAGEEITIYVGNLDLQTGTNTDLYLVATQYNAESGNFMKQIGRLKVGENTFTIPAIVSKDFERGGSLYVYYAASNKTSKYGVRVAGGTTIPMLDLYGIEDEAQRLALTEAYVEELETYVAGLEELHEQEHAGSSNANVNYEYNEEECILGATELMGDHMLFSLSAQQVLAGLGSGTTAEKARRLNDSMLAMDQTMELFYQHKGLTEKAADPINRVPSQHLNIRYMRMFAGAFMYAAGNHIGIGWGSVPGVVQGKTLQADENGAYLSGDLFGWGIGHEIGHDINQFSYAIAEVTNNYFAQLATYGTSGVRFGYSAVYDKVTSGTIGRASDVFLQLAMYWQLRLAYDNYYPYKTFDTEQEVFNNLFFARVDTYSRTPSKAPAPNGVALKLDGGSEQNIIRLASSAAQKDLSEFFLRWGLVANDETTQYVSQFEPETRAIYYVNDSAQSYRIQNPDGQSLKDQSVISAANVTLTQGNGANGLAQNQVSLTINPENASASLLGYEINRISISGGKETNETVGFVLADENGAAGFTDTVTTINNRAFTYQIVPVDQYLDYAQAVSLEAIKISHDGSQDKSAWTVTTNMTSEQDTEVDHDEQDPDAGFDPGAHDHATVKSAIGLAFDDSLSTTYTGTAEGSDPMIEVEFGKELDVTGFKFTLMSGAGEIPAGTLALQLEENGQWVDVPVSVESLQTTGSTTVYAVNDEGWIRTSGATALRLIFQGAQSVSITELDVLGPTGDNVEMLQDGIGILAEDYIYDQGLYEKSEHTDGFIPAGSVIFVGEYKGNPAYNAVIVYDQDGKIVGYGDNGEGSAEQIILAPVPDKGDLGNTSDGRWVYWISPDAVLPEKVRVELYRVDDALTNQGQRLVSDSLWVQVPESLPSITISGDK